MNPQKKRALILAGGGVKVAFQAGVLQVWLDEAGLTFDLADGASGGTFNLAMLCQGMTGTQIADNWRNTDPKAAVDFNWTEYLKLFNAESMFTLDSYRKNVFTAWGLDWDKIRDSSLEATFNVYNVTDQQLEVVTPDRMSEDMLVACVSLPMWFPPARIGDRTYIDPVFVTDANLEEAIRRGADELWIIWTVSQKGEWHGGFVGNYFGIIESCANGPLKRALERIRLNNAAVEAGERGEFGRPIEVKMLQAEVGVHYLVNFSQDRAAEAVNAGVEHARRWCAENGIPLAAPAPSPPSVAPISLEFTETMKGFVSLGETDFEAGQRKGKRNKTKILFRLTIRTDDVDRFITDPDHEATAEGYVESDSLGGRRPLQSGVFNLFVSPDDPSRKRMLYRLFFQVRVNGVDQPATLSGHKEIFDDPGFDLWSDTTTLYTRIYRGHVSAQEETGAEVLASGIMVIHLLDFMKQLTTFRTRGGGFVARGAALARFGKLFLGKLWDVYARNVLTSAPF